MKLIQDVISSEIKGIWGEELSEGEVGVPVIKTNNLGYDGSINLTNLTLRKLSDKDLAGRFLMPGDLLVEKSGGTKTHSVGYAAFFEGSAGKYVANNFIMVLRPDSRLVVPKYLFYQMRYMYESGRFEDCYNKTTGIQNLKTKLYLSKPIRLPQLEKQTNVVRLLDTIQNEIGFMREQVLLLDEQVKSLFNDLLTSSEYPLQPLGTTCEIITGNTPPRSDKENYGSYIEWIKSDNISDAKYPSTAEEFLSEKGCALGRSAPADSILMVCIAGSIKSIGRCALLNRRACFNQQINALIPKRYEPVFLLYLLRYEKKIFEESIHNALKGILSKSALASIELPVLPLPLQRAVANKINQIDKLRFNYQRQIEVLQELMDKKMEEYFGNQT